MVTYGRNVRKIEKRCYLDHAATSPLRAEARAAMVAAMDVVGNPATLHTSGRAARARLEDARESIAADLGAHPTEVVFTSGGSEADSIAVLGAQGAPGGAAIVSAIEHPGVRGALTRGGIAWPVLPTGVLNLAAAPGGPAAIVSVMAVNNETGVVQPVAAVVEHARRLSAWAHSDIVQAVGHVPFDFAASGLDLASVSAHKVGGPVGVGALLARREVKLAAIGLGGGQEREVRSGTQAVMLASGFAAALRAAVADIASATSRYRAWQTRILDACLALPDVTSVARGADTSPHITHVTFRGLRADDLLLLLDAAGIDASVGSACRAGVHRPSEVLLAMGYSDDDALASVRFSVGHSTTDAEIDHLIEALPSAVMQARAARPAG